MHYCQPIDIANRIYCIMPYWYRGTPIILINGNEGEFGELIFEFRDRTIKFKLWIKNKVSIVHAARDAITNFAALNNEE